MGMAWDEWEQLKAEVAERNSAQMQLNQLPADPGTSGGDGSSWGGGDGNLKSSKSAWVKAGDDVGSLRKDISTALTELTDGQKGLVASDCTVLTLGAQSELFDSWDRYVKAVRKRSDALAKLLEQTGHGLYSTDQSIENAFRKLGKEYEDTAAIGGQAKGR
jgi:hypothetical protein